MGLIRSLMGRRQFLIAAGAVSTSALACRKLTGVVDTGFQTGIANALERKGDVDIKAINNRYSHLLSPIKVGSMLLKNRMYSTNNAPHNLQGPENFPAELSRAYAANLAKNGAAIVNCYILHNRVREELHGDTAHMVIYDLEDYGVQNYIDQMVEGVHCYGSKASVFIRVAPPESGPGGGAPPAGAADGEPGTEPRGAGFGGGEPDGGMPGGAPGGGMPGGAPGGGMPGGAPGGGMPGGVPGGGFGAGAAQTVELTVEYLEKAIEEAVKQAKYYKEHGFDMVYIRESVTNPYMKTKIGKYGGESIKERAGFSIDLYQAIKKACGQDFGIETLMTIIEPSIEQTEAALSFTLEDAIEFAKLYEGMVDILQLRVSGGTANHPMGWNSEKGKPPLSLRFATAIKKSGVKIAVAPNGGFGDLDLNEEYIASGKTDLIAMARPFIADWEYGEKAYEGRGEDVVPCILCNKCHGLSQSSKWYDVCSVNPRLGTSPANKLIKAPAESKKVAVIGGGPAGMKAAIIAAERGHKVTIYEKNDYLGGLLRHTDFASFQWPLKDFKDYLIRQVNKTGVHVLLNTSATPEMIRKKGYDVILVAAGTDPIIPKIPAADGSNIWNVVNVYGNEKALGKNVVVLGGERGAETGLHLSQCGHKVTVLASGRRLVQPGGPHQGIQFPNKGDFSYILQATATRISKGKVSYKDAKGGEKSVQADSVVIYAGLKPRQDEALKFYGSAKQQFFIIGDCSDMGGNVQKSIRSAFFAASQI